MNVQVFGIKNDANTRKALRFFKERRVSVHFVDFKVKGPSKGELKRFAQRFGGAEALIDRSGKRFNALGLQAAYYGDERWLDMAVDEPMIATRCRPGSATGCLSDKSRCLTHDLWEELSNQIHRYLSSVSLADVINKRILTSAMLDGPFAQPRPQPQTAPVAVMAPAE